MKIKLILVIVLLLLILYAHPSRIIALTENKPTLVVMSIDAHKVFTNEVHILSNLLTSAFYRIDQFTVIDISERDRLLRDADYTISRCQTDACLVEGGKLIHANFMLVGQMRVLSSKYELTLKFIEVTTGKIEQSITKRYKFIEHMYKDVYSLIKKLLGMPEEVVLEKQKIKKKNSFLQYNHSSFSIGQNFEFLLNKNPFKEQQIGMYSTLNFTYNIAYPGGVIGFGLLSAFTMYMFNSEEIYTVQIDEYSFENRFIELFFLSWPQAITIKFQKNFFYPFYGLAELNLGLLFYLCYIDSQIIDSVSLKNGLWEVRPFGAVQLGLGLNINPWLAVVACSSLQAYFLENKPFWFTTFGLRFDWNV